MFHMHAFLPDTSYNTINTITLEALVSYAEFQSAEPMHVLT